MTNENKPHDNIGKLDDAIDHAIRTINIKYSLGQESARFKTNKVRNILQSFNADIQTIFNEENDTTEGVADNKAPSLALTDDCLKDLARVSECFITELLLRSADCANKENSKKITDSNIFKALISQDELDFLANIITDEDISKYKEQNE